MPLFCCVVLCCAVLFNAASMLCCAEPCYAMLRRYPSLLSICSRLHVTVCASEYFGYSCGHTGFYILHITCYMPHFTYYVLCITYYVLRITYYVLRIMYYILRMHRLPVQAALYLCDACTIEGGWGGGGGGRGGPKCMFDCHQ